MATQSTWRSAGNGGGPRWGPGANTGGAGAGARGIQASTQPAQPVNGVAKAPAVNAPISNAFPPLGNSKTSKLEGEEGVQRDRTLYLLVGLVGNTVEATTRTQEKYIGILSSTSTPDDGKDSLGAVLSCAQQLMPDNSVGPLKKILVIKGEDLDGLVVREVGLDVPVSMQTSSDRVGFRTDTEISKTAIDGLGEGRMLQPWTGDGDVDLSLDGGNSTSSSHATGGWDQFAANEAKFGIKSNYEESMYTTKLDRSTKDFKERERKADQLAREIMGSATSNTHIAEERNIAESEAAQTEEDKYGAVARNGTAYLPPGARRAAVAAAATATASASARSNNAATANDSKATDGASPNAPSIVTTAPGADPARRGSGAEKQQQGAVDDFRQFVSHEKEKMFQRKAALAKKEKESKLAEFKSWSDKFKLSFPSSSEDTAKAGQAQGKSTTVAEAHVSSKPRDPSLKKSLSPTPSNASKTQGTGESSGSASAMHSPTIGAGTRALAVAPASKAAAASSTKGSSSTTARSANPLAESKAFLASMAIPKIPPYDPTKMRARQAEGGTTFKAAQAGGSVDAAAQTSTASGAAAALPNSKSTFKLSANASAFKPFNPNAAAFTPGGVAQRASLEPGPIAPSPVIKPAVPSSPFFGNRVVRKQQTPLHVREDFNPFKTSKMPLASTVGPTWGFTGKPYRHLFHVIPSEEHSGTPSASSQQHTPQQPHAAVMQHGGGSGNGGLPPGIHTAPMAGQQPMQQQPPHLGGVPPNMQSPMQQQQHHHPQQQPGQHHMLQHHAQGMSHTNAAGAGQPIYMPYGAYRFQGGQQPVQHMGGPYMAPQFVGHQMPFSPPMPHNGPTGLYSPQMQNMMPAPPPPTMLSGGAAPPPPRGGVQGMPPPHMQPKGVPPPPPHMYFPGGGQHAMPGMPYGGPPFPPSAGPSPVVRHQQQHHPHQGHPAAQQPGQQLPMGMHPRLSNAGSTGGAPLPMAMDASARPKGGNGGAPEK